MRESERVSDQAPRCNLPAASHAGPKHELKVETPLEKSALMSVCTRKANFTKFYGLVSPSRVSQATGEAFSLLPSPQRLEPEAASSFVSSLARRKIEVSSAATRCTRDSKSRRLIRRTSQPKRVPSLSLRGTFLRSRRSYRSSFARPSVCIRL